MNREEAFELLLAQWLEEGPYEAPRGPVAAALAHVRAHPKRSRTLASRWLVAFSRDRREKVMAERLAGERLDALAGQGGAFKKKDDIFRMAQANKAFAHYRW